MLVLNATYEPINVRTVRRATVLLLQGQGRGRRSRHRRSALGDRLVAAPGRHPPGHLRPDPAGHAQAQDHAPRRVRPRRVDVPVLRRPHEPDGRPRDPALQGRRLGLGQHRRGLRAVQPPQGRPAPAPDPHASADQAAHALAPTSSSSSRRRPSRRRGGSTCRKRLKLGLRPRFGRLLRGVMAQGPRRTSRRRWGPKSGVLRGGWGNPTACDVLDCSSSFTPGGSGPQGHSPHRASELRQGEARPRPVAGRLLRFAAAIASTIGFYVLAARPRARAHRPRDRPLGRGRAHEHLAHDHRVRPGRIDPRRDRPAPAEVRGARHRGHAGGAARAARARRGGGRRRRRADARRRLPDRLEANAAVTQASRIPPGADHRRPAAAHPLRAPAARRDRPRVRPLLRRRHPARALDLPHARDDHPHGRAAQRRGRRRVLVPARRPPAVHLVRQGVPAHHREDLPPAGVRRRPPRGRQRRSRRLRGRARARPRVRAGVRLRSGAARSRRCWTAATGRRSRRASAVSSSTATSPRPPTSISSGCGKRRPIRTTRTRRCPSGWPRSRTSRPARRTPPRARSSCCATRPASSRPSCASCSAPRSSGCRRSSGTRSARSCTAAAPAS